MRQIPEKESLRVEFKSDKKKLKDSVLVEEVTGMTNTEGGDLFLGVEDDGTITGVHRDHADETGVSAMIGNRTIPSVPVRAQLITENDTEVLKISIPVSRSVISTSDGKILRRRLKVDGSPEVIPMRPFEITTRLSDLGSMDFSATVLDEAGPEDLDAVERQRLRRLIQARNGDQYLLELEDEELDQALGLMRNGHPTLTGLLLIGKEESLRKYIPTASSAFQVLHGMDVEVNEDYHQPLLQVFEIMLQYFNARNPEKELQRGLQRIPIPEFSAEAFREGLVNAFAHRDYSKLGRIRVAVEDEGITITSPGSFVEDITFRNLLTAEPRSRNPLLADALKRIGLAEKTGRGVDRIYEGSILYGRPLPDYSESNGSYVKLFIPRHEADREFMTMILDYQEKEQRKLPIYSLLILSALLEQHRMTLKDLADTTGLSMKRVQVHIEKLVEAGMVEARGTGTARTYILSSKVYSSRDNLYGYVRQTAQDAASEKDLVLKLAGEQKGTVSRQEIAELLQCTGQQAYRLLKEMEQAGILEKNGAGRSTRYKVVNEIRS